MIMMEGWYTLEEVEQQRGIPARILRYWITNGLPARKIGQAYVIQVADLDAFIEERVEVLETKRYQLRPPKEDKK